jgi:hypothetical protein
MLLLQRAWAAACSLPVLLAAHELLLGVHLGPVDNDSLGSERGPSCLLLQRRLPPAALRGSLVLFWDPHDPGRSALARVQGVPGDHFVDAYGRLRALQSGQLWLSAEGLDGGEGAEAQEAAQEAAAAAGPQAAVVDSHSYGGPVPLVLVQGIAVARLSLKGGLQRLQ